MALDSIRRGIADQAFHWDFHDDRIQAISAEIRSPDDVQTFGDLVNFNPHLHVLAADGAFLPNGRFVVLPRVPASLLAEGFRRDVLAFLVKSNVLSEEFAQAIKNDLAKYAKLVKAAGIQPQ